jgi:peptide/nickel transport system substrate-binding protein
MSSLAALALSVALIVSACAPAASGPSATPEPVATEPGVGGDDGELMRVGWGDGPDTLNPAYAFIAQTFTIFPLIYSTLTTQAPDGSYVGDLAESWIRSDDGLTWTFTLRDGVTYHNGTPLTAEDVAWSINAIMADPDGWVAMVTYTNGFASVEAPDARTLVIATEYPVANMAYRLSVINILYRPDFEGFTTPEDLQGFANAQAIGSGPFALEVYDKDQGVVILRRNDTYYGTRSAIPGLVFQVFDNDDALVSAIRAGDIDVVWSVPSSAYTALQGQPGIVVGRAPSRAFDELILNVADPARDPAPTGNPGLRDTRVREAINYAINKQDIVDVALSGLGKPEWSIIAPPFGGGQWYNSALEDRAYDPERARQLLDEAGFVPGADGIRERDGVRLDLRLEFDAGAASYARIASLLEPMLSEVGIRVASQGVDFDTLVAKTTGVGDFDLVIWGWGGGDPDPDFQLSTMTCEQFELGGWSDSGYCNPEYDALYLEQQQAVEQTERKRIIDAMQALLHRDLPYIVLYNSENVEAYRSDRFTGFPDYTQNPAIAQTYTSLFTLLNARPVE